MTPLLEYQLVASLFVTLAGGGICAFIASPLLGKTIGRMFRKLAGFMITCAVLEIVGLFVLGAFWFVWSVSQG